MWIRIFPKGYLKIVRCKIDFRIIIDSKEKSLYNAYPLYQWNYFRYRIFQLIADKIRNLQEQWLRQNCSKAFSALIYIIEEAKAEKYKERCDLQFIETFKDM